MKLWLGLVAVLPILAFASNRTSCYRYIACFEQSQKNLRDCVGGTAVALILESKDQTSVDFMKNRGRTFNHCQDRLVNDVIDYETLEVLLNEDARECFEKLPGSTKNTVLDSASCEYSSFAERDHYGKDTSQCVMEFNADRQFCESQMACCPDVHRCGERMNAVSVAYQHAKSKGSLIVSSMLNCIMTNDRSSTDEGLRLLGQRSTLRNPGLPFFRPDTATEERILRRLSLTAQSTLEVRKNKFSRRYQQVRALLAQRHRQSSLATSSPSELRPSDATVAPAEVAINSQRKLNIVKNLLRNANDGELSTYVGLIMDGNFEKLSQLEKEKLDKIDTEEKVNVAMDKMKKIRDAIKAALATKNMKTIDFLETAGATTTESPLVDMEDKASDNEWTLNTDDASLAHVLAQADEETLFRAKKFASLVGETLSAQKELILTNDNSFTGNGLPTARTASTVATRLDRDVHDFTTLTQSVGTDGPKEQQQSTTAQPEEPTTTVAATAETTEAASTTSEPSEISSTSADVTEVTEEASSTPAPKEEEKTETKIEIETKPVDPVSATLVDSPLNEDTVAVATVTPSVDEVKPLGVAVTISGDTEAVTLTTEAPVSLAELKQILVEEKQRNELKRSLEAQRTLEKDEALPTLVATPEAQEFLKEVAAQTVEPQPSVPSSVDHNTMTNMIDEMKTVMVENKVESETVASSSPVPVPESPKIEAQVEGSGEEQQTVDVTVEPEVLTTTLEETTTVTVVQEAATTASQQNSFCVTYANCDEMVKDYADQCDRKYSKDIISHGIDDAEIVAILHNASVSHHEIVYKACLRPLDRAAHSQLKQLLVIERGVRKACLELGRNKAVLSDEELSVCTEPPFSTQAIDDFLTSEYRRSDENLLTCHAKLAPLRDTCQAVSNCCASKLACDNYIASSPVRLLKDESIEKLVTRQTECEKRMLETLKYINEKLQSRRRRVL